jgi:S-adenosylmethionine hydrolase
MGKRSQATEGPQRAGLPSPGRQECHPGRQAPVITLLTDFGLSDTYVGVMKGVILGICPTARLVDLTHAVPPQDVASGAWQLAAACAYFPAGTVHLAVVDPGVGSERRAIAVETPRGALVGPDNGLLGDALRRLAGGIADRAGRLRLKAPVRAVELTNPEYRLSAVSRTFHGRDIFAPAAAHLAAGVSLERLGSPVDAIAVFDRPAPYREGDRLVGRVIHVDAFGNLITDLAATQLPTHPIVEVGGVMLRGLRPSYADAAGLLALIGSDNTLEISYSGGSAARELGVGMGAEVRVTAG